jgi:predicted enzyme related to lactoylglutathione lyase
MSGVFKSTRDVILRTEMWHEVVQFYGSVLGLPIASEDASMVGFETGSFRLYIEKGTEHGPVFEFLVHDVAGAKQRLLAAGCTIVEENPSVPRCYIRDPFGLVFNVGQSSEPK